MKPVRKHSDSFLHSSCGEVNRFRRSDTPPITFCSSDNSQSSNQGQGAQAKDEGLQNITMLFEDIDEELLSHIDAFHSCGGEVQHILAESVRHTLEDINDEDLIFLDTQTSSQSFQTQQESRGQVFDESLEAIFAEIIDEDFLDSEETSPPETTDKGDSLDEDWIASAEMEAELIELSSSTKIDNLSKILASQESPIIVRPPFAKLAKDQSPICGLSTDIVVQTCFRVGEVLNAGAEALKRRQHVMLEIYACVISSYRENGTNKQHFVLGDLFHDNAPHIDGTYELWKEVDLWEHDSAVFLNADDKRRICRCMAHAKKEGNKWRLRILNIWEATWDDVEYVKGIICAQ